MAKQVQFRRGTTVEHSGFTGAAGEVTVDISLNTVRVHDGSTAGGTRLARYSEIVPSSRTVTAGSGLTGGGALSSDIVISIGSGIAQLNTAQSFTKAQRGVVVTLSGLTITPDFSAGNNFKTTLTGATTLIAPAEAVEGQSGIIAITQDGTGGRTLSFSGWKFSGGEAPNVSTTSGATDLLAYYVESSSRISAQLLNDVK
jgi:hypothetical protein